MKTSLRIAIDLTPLRPGGENGGAKLLVTSLLQQLQELAPQHHFLLLTAPWNHLELARYETNNAERLLMEDIIPEPEKILSKSKFFNKIIKKIPNKIKLKLNKIVASKSLILNKKIDLLFCPFTAPTYATKNIPLVAIAYDLQHLDYPFFFTPEERQHRTRFLNDLLNKSQKVICISEFTRQSFIKHFNTSEEKFAVIPISIHDRLPKLSENTILEHLRNLGLAERQYAFYPANYWPHKNHRLLLTAYGMYKKQFPDRALDLVFTGALEREEKQLREAAYLMGLSDNVHFLGFLSEEALASVWQGCKCLIFPSLYEGFGIPVLEAMRFGKPVLSSNVGSLPEVGGDAVLYFDPRKPNEIVSCLAQIAEDEVLGDELVSKGTRRLKLFDRQDMARQYLTILETAALNRDTSIQSAITGVYEDGWSASEFDISVEAGLPGRTLVLVVETPGSYPVSKARIRFKTKHKKAVYNCTRGQLQEIVWPLLPTGEAIAVQISPSFQPRKLYKIADNRHLGLVVRDCRIQSADGTFFSMFTSSCLQHFQALSGGTANGLTSLVVASQAAKEYNPPVGEPEPEITSDRDWQAQLDIIQAELYQAQAKIAAMESSKFWKLRTLWFRIKQIFRLPIN